jgi:hypothetical protein
MTALRWMGLAMLALFASASASAQAPYQPPLASDGRPDLQGNWTTRWTTPLERPADYTALIVSAEEGARLHRAHLARLSSTDPLGPEYAWDLSGPLVIGGETRSSLIVDPPDGRLPVTAEGSARRSAFVRFSSADDPEARGLNERCLMAGSGYAPFLTIPASNIRRIVQTRDAVVMHTESFSQLRIIPVHGLKGPAIPRGGSSAGRWEGDTLVVETAGFLASDGARISPGSTFPISPQTQISERFTRTGADEISYRFTVEDATLYSQAWTAESLLKRTDDPMFEWACHEGNYGLANILRGARVVEKRDAAAAEKGKQ